MNNQSKTFCMHPFTGLATREDGAIKICCRSLPIGWIQEESLESVWNNETMKNVRKQILNNERPEVCKPCFDLEDQGVESLRQRHINGVIPEARINLYPNALDQLTENYTMPFEFPTMEIKLNNLCNLKCRMCNPLDSTSWKDWDEVKPFYEKENNYLVPTVSKLVRVPGQYIGPFDNTDNWWKDFEKLIPYFRRVEFAGGEPLMDPQHYKILDMLKPYGKNIELKYATNGTTLGISKGRTIHDYWPHFRSIAVNVSIDGIHDVYNYIRSNSNFSEVEKNIKEIKSLPNISRIVGAFTAQAGNILQAAECIDYFINEMGIVFYSHRVSYPNVLSAQVLPQPLKEEAINRLKSVEQRLFSFPAITENALLEKITRQQIKDNINYLNAKDQSHLWLEFLDFNRKLDITRNQSLLDAVPEFAAYA
ncbi:twitch domain-containing radical SAM protein [bacterium]|nr:twitch domain-containing radical SAM protein [Candidatus Elulimicrobium humile]